MTNANAFGTIRYNKTQRRKTEPENSFAINTMAKRIRKPYIKETRTIKPREREFVRALADPASKTYGNATASVQAAGFRTKAPEITGTLLLQKPFVKEFLREYVEKYENINEFKAEFARKQLLETYARAIEAKDITGQVACVRLMMQTTGQLTDKLVIDITGARQLDESRREEARKIASIVLNVRILGTNGSAEDESGLAQLPESDQTDDPDNIVQTDDPEGLDHDR